MSKIPMVNIFLNVVMSTLSKNIFWCLGNGYCSDGKIQEEKTLCNGVCPITIGWKVSIPCKNNKTGAIQCSDKVNANSVCRGISTNVCPE